MQINATAISILSDTDAGLRYFRAIWAWNATTQCHKTVECWRTSGVLFPMLCLLVEGSGFSVL